MPGCPACGSEVPSNATECPRCHLAVHLFDAVREAVGVPESDPAYAVEIRELLKAVEPAVGGPSPSTPSPGPGAFAYPPRFLATPPPGAPFPDAPTPPPLSTFPKLPALPGGGIAGLRHQLDDYLQLARRQELDVSEISGRIKEALPGEDAATLEALVRELFVRLAASLSEEFEEAVAKRNGLSTLISTATPDLELGACREMISSGDLAGAERRLRQVHDELAALEDHWATVQILIAECDLLAETARELGGDPGPALGPLEEGRRIARGGGRADAEPVLAKAALALWSTVNPRFGPEMHRIKDRLLERRRAGEDVSGAVEQFRELAAHLSRRNFAATILCYRKLRELVDSTGPPNAPEGVPVPVAVGGPVPSGSSK